MDGQTEVMNRTLEDYLRAFTRDGQDKWDEMLTMVWEFRSSLGVAIGRAALARPRTGTSEPFGRGPVTGGLGRIAFTVPMS